MGGELSTHSATVAGGVCVFVCVLDFYCFRCSTYECMYFGLRSIIFCGFCG